MHLQVNIDGLVQERHNSIANALELCLSFPFFFFLISCTNPSVWPEYEGKNRYYDFLSVTWQIILCIQEFLYKMISNMVFVNLGDCVFTK